MRLEPIRLGELLLAETLAGVRQQEPHGDAAMPYVAATLVSGGRGAISTSPPDVTLPVPLERTAMPGDILLASRGVDRRETIPGAIVRVDDPLAYADSLIRLRVDPGRADPEYVRLYLTSRAGAATVAAAATGTTISYLRPAALEGIKLMLPPLAYQQAVAAEVVAMEAGLAELESTVDAFRSLLGLTIEGIITGTLEMRADVPTRAMHGGRQ
jgi:hypothetical protein